MSSDDLYINCLRDVIDFLRQFLPPDKDFAISLHETPYLTYVLGREGVYVSQRRVEEHLPFLSTSYRKISLENIPNSILRSIDLCNVIRQMINENIRWLESGYGSGEYYSAAKKIISDKDKLLQIFRCVE